MGPENQVFNRINSVLADKLKGCLMLGAIGDSIGGKYEGTQFNQHVDLNSDWQISDDTQLTLATCEAICYSEHVNPEKVAARFLYWYNCHKQSGLGTSTLKALRELQVGGHWALVGRSGEYAAGNGAAMRIAPLAFKDNISRITIRDISSITHKNDEAYCGALAIFYSIQNAVNGNWKGNSDLIELIIEQLPDTRVRDRFIAIQNVDPKSISELGKQFTPTGYVVDSVPVSVYAAQQIEKLSYSEIFTELIKIGGDTDTTCSMTGQILGALKGAGSIPQNWRDNLKETGVLTSINDVVSKWIF
ncbi:MAG: hypothetical protein GC181_10560 [Bacteroidetes bacterium]|nr:hypothetical protein [Bacteroidota bacterium]